MGWIIYTFQNFNGATVEVWEWISNLIPHLLDMWLLIHAGIKLIHVDKGVPWYFVRGVK